MPTEQRPADRKAPVPTRASVVSIQIYPAAKALLRERLATGEFTDGTVAEISLHPNTGAVLVQFGAESPWYAFSPEAIAAAALRIHKKGGRQ